jgi:hypothetical protein
MIDTLLTENEIVRAAKPDSSQGLQTLAFFFSAL